MKAEYDSDAVAGEPELSDAVAGKPESSDTVSDESESSDTVSDESESSDPISCYSEFASCCSSGFSTTSDCPLLFISSPEVAFPPQLTRSNTIKIKDVSWNKS
jgi:hypothetical protein